VKVGSSHRARKDLFRRGLRQGYLTLTEIDAALPPATTSQGERWLLLYSLRAAGVDLRDVSGAGVELPPPPAGD
jgi:hypothetical protein